MDNHAIAPSASESTHTESRPKIGYRADRGRRETVYFLSAEIVALALFSLYPAVLHFQFPGTPSWVMAMMLIALVQIAYSVWLALAPDWCSLWVTMLALAGIAAIYATAMAVLIGVQPGAETIFDLGELKQLEGRRAALWCTIVVLLSLLLAYLCGRASHRWHRSYRMAFKDR